MKEITSPSILHRRRKGGERRAYLFLKRKRSCEARPIVNTSTISSSLSITKGAGFAEAEGAGFAEAEGAGFAEAEGAGFAEAEGAGFAEAEGAGFADTDGESFAEAFGYHQR